MSFPIVFMYNNEPMNKIVKRPEERFTATGDLRDECSIVDPEFIVEVADPTTANYAYIGPWHRYYYITDITAYRSFLKDNVMHNLWKIKMHCDVLYTFSEGILNSPCVVGKSSTSFNMYLNDSHYKCKQNDLISVQNFPQGFDLTQARFVLTLLGGRTQTAPPTPPTP